MAVKTTEKFSPAADTGTVSYTASVEPDGFVKRGGRPGKTNPVQPILDSLLKAGDSRTHSIVVGSQEEAVKVRAHFRRAATTIEKKVRTQIAELDGGKRKVLFRVGPDDAAKVDAAKVDA
jgi:hypothetical protein